MCGMRVGATCPVPLAGYRRCRDGAAPRRAKESRGEGSLGWKNQKLGYILLLVGDSL